MILCTSAGLIKIWSTIEPDPHFRYVFTSPLFAINISNYTKASNKLFYVWVSFPEPFWPRYQRWANTCLCTLWKESIRTHIYASIGIYLSAPAGALNLTTPHRSVCPCLFSAVCHTQVSQKPWYLLTLNTVERWEQWTHTYVVNDIVI